MSTSQFFGLNIGYTGLQAANAALNVTGNNISNVETKGYTRQEAKQVAADALRTNTSYGMAGAGVDTKSIDQIDGLLTLKGLRLIYEKNAEN